MQAFATFGVWFSGKKTEWCFLCEFETHVDRASRSREPFSPFNILSRLPHIGGNLGFGNQEDAHEFMRFFIFTLPCWLDILFPPVQISYHKLMSLYRFAIDSMQSVFLDQFGGEKALHSSSQETTLIQYIFGGHLLSQVSYINTFFFIQWNWTCNMLSVMQLQHNGDRCWWRLCSGFALLRMHFYMCVVTCNL